jgi:CubicO group peptidase (beta-lactamase class C family)
MRLLLPVCFATACAVASFGQASPVHSSQRSLRESLDQKIPLWLKASDVPSIAVAYIDHGKIAWTKVYGEQSPGVPANDKTLYNIASLTKPISSEVILRLDL